MTKKGGSGSNKQLLHPAPVIKATPVLSNAYLYGPDAASNAAGFLRDYAITQNNLVTAHRGGGHPHTLSPAPIDSNAGAPIVVPQFNEILPASPVNSNSASIANNSTRLTGLKNSMNDHYAFSGGKNKKRQKQNVKRVAVVQENIGQQPDLLVHIKKDLMKNIQHVLFV